MTSLALLNPKGAEPVSRATAKRPTYVMRLRPLPGVDAVRALRALVKLALRRFGLRVLEAREDGGER